MGHLVMMSRKQQKTIVVGAGPVGSLAALYAAQRGENVEIYELRGDLRDPTTVPLNFTKSINLALSERGINAIRHSNRPDLLNSVLQETIPMSGRMIHGEKHGKMSQESQAYDIHGRFIRACDRAGLNKRLLNELEQMTNVKFFFNHKLVGANFKRNLAWFERKLPATDVQTATAKNQDIFPTEIEVSFDFMIGADGAHSATRYHLMKFARMNYQQEYINTLWCEFHMTPETSSGEPAFKISPNHLHIWPCGSFMFIAIPSSDKSFTCTLFMSASKFQELDDKPQDLIPFFKKNFPGVVPDLISETEVQHQYNNNPHLPLISIKCKPYHYKSSVVILGDAAHAMVPFYGQGMNAGLEDVRVLFTHLDRYTKDSSETESIESKRGKALSEYTQSRHSDAVAINDLALRNYQEMSHDVTSSMYLLRKFVEERLDAYLPSLGWATQYSRISFGNERYSEVEKAEKKQRTIMLGIIGLIAGTLGSWTAWRILRWHRVSPLSTTLATWLASLAKSSKELVKRFT